MNTVQWMVEASYGSVTRGTYFVEYHLDQSSCDSSLLVLRASEYHMNPPYVDHGFLESDFSDLSWRRYGTTVDWLTHGLETLRDELREYSQVLPSRWFTSPSRLSYEQKKIDQLTSSVYHFFPSSGNRVIKSVSPSFFCSSLRRTRCKKRCDLSTIFFYIKIANASRTY